ncbi:5-formyltetrahydrofolate cyclo-ligase [Sulfurimonas marina]|uniref:5-formyltetrahydrofolate cyclo-ligase n=2 Tax=Sulfurimonas marina TaxID=2590551 RepID=A0A7M1AY64_9BACT|nr:5-formyltetrahydrofolate cyclo-ligase [Sulfurimonas marina]
MTLTKETFRKNSIEKIQNLHTYNKVYRDALLEQKLLRLLKKYKHRNILVYHPLPFEADIRKSITKMRRKLNVYVPFMEGESFKMVPFRLPLKKKKFGIFEAGDTIRNIKKIDIAIVPSIGVDGDLKRIGFGKGMYDRFFAKLKKKPYTIFVQPVLCYTRESICDSYDVEADVLITPTAEIFKGHIAIKKGN